MERDYFPLSFCPTGMVPTKEQNPGVPITPQEIANQVISVAGLGITSVHLHARNEDQSPAWERDWFARTISLIREQIPGLVICVTTSGRTVSEFEKRSDVLHLDGDVKPDLASLTLASMNFSQSASLNSPQMVQSLAKLMLERGIKPELEIFDTGMLNYVQYLIGKEILQPPYVVNVILGGIATAQADALDLGVLLQKMPENSAWQVGGIGKAQLRANVLGLASGGGVRVGLEDSLYFDSEQKQLATNQSLVERIHGIAEKMGRTVMPPQIFRERYLSSN